MGSRLLPLLLALGALGADATGLRQLASYLVLLAVVGAAAAAFVCVGDALAGRGSWLAGISSGLALMLLLLGSAVRAAAAVGAGVPTLALSSLVLASLLYSLPVLGWVFQPLAPRPRDVRVRAHAS
jgi:hypothetical protein